MLIIADDRIPAQAKAKLKEYGEILYLKTSGITYDAISGHPDIFFCAAGDRLIIAPNLPDAYKNFLEEKRISYLSGEFPLGDKYPASAGYNVVITDKYLIHNFRYTDPAITRKFDDRELIHVNQGYCRCNLLPLREDHFITSDEGIERVLKNYQLNTLYVDPSEIVLPGKDHGFFGGCCGIFENRVFVLGSLSYQKTGETIRNYLEGLGYQIIELFEGPLFDGGGIFFIRD